MSARLVAVAALALAALGLGSRRALAADLAPAGLPAYDAMSLDGIDAWAYAVESGPGGAGWSGADAWDAADAAPAAVSSTTPDPDANLRAFLMMIRHAEGTAGPDGYRTLFGGSLFDSFADHPRRAIRARLRTGYITSTAAGAYQFLSTTWDGVARALQLPDFSPESQDAGAVELIRRRGALDAVQAGRFEEAVRLCRKEWASLPGAGYGQPEKQLAELRTVYVNAGGLDVAA